MLGSTRQTALALTLTPSSGTDAAPTWASHIRFHLHSASCHPFQLEVASSTRNSQRARRVGVYAHALPSATWFASFCLFSWTSFSFHFLFAQLWRRVSATQANWDSLEFIRPRIHVGNAALYWSTIELLSLSGISLNDDILLELIWLLWNTSS